MEIGFAFESIAPDGTKYRVLYKPHFVQRFDTDDPEHPAVKRRITEESVKEKILEAIPKIDDSMFGKSLKGAIVSHSLRFVMLFSVQETNYGYELSMFNMSNRIDFKLKSSKEVIIKVNPIFTVRFSESYSFGLKISILADISENWKGIENGVLYHLGGDLLDYWLERGGDIFWVSGADWIGDFVEIEVA